MDIDRAHRLVGDFFSSGKVLTFDRRDTVIGYGAETTHGYLIIEGCVKVMTYTGSGSERIHYLYGPGDIFPVTSLFSPRQFELGFTAFTPLKVMQKPLDELKEFFTKEPHALLAILDQQTSAYGRIINLNMGTAEQRLAYRLITLTQRFGKQEGDHYVVNLPLTIQSLADMVRLTRETTGKIMAKFEQKGYVILGRQQILIYPDQLRVIAQE